MPIYEYQCGSCGFKKEHLQKLSDGPIKDCPECGSDSYTKLISAAGFQLKGAGWYVTDFKNGSLAKPKTGSKEKNKPVPETKPKTTSDTNPKTCKSSTTK